MERVPVYMTPTEKKAIDDWRFEMRIGSRAEAIRILISEGIKQARSSGCKA